MLHCVVEWCNGETGQAVAKGAAKQKEQGCFENWGKIMPLARSYKRKDE